MGWLDSLPGSVVGFDTMPLIYYIEENPLPNLKTLVLDDLKKGAEG